MEECTIFLYNKDDVPLMGTSDRWTGWSVYEVLLGSTELRKSSRNSQEEIDIY